MSNDDTPSGPFHGSDVTIKRKQADGSWEEVGVLCGDVETIDFDASDIVRSGTIQPEDAEALREMLAQTTDEVITPRQDDGSTYEVLNYWPGVPWESDHRDIPLGTTHLALVPGPMTMALKELQDE